MDEKKNPKRKKVFPKVRRVTDGKPSANKLQLSKTDLRSSCKRKKAKEVQAKKSTRRMPWHQEPKKDAANCEKLWGTVSGY